MTRVNAAWHRAHRMPPRATLAERLRWHRAHAKACACREMPRAIAEALAKSKRTMNRRAPRSH